MDAAFIPAVSTPGPVAIVSNAIAAAYFWFCLLFTRGEALSRFWDATGIPLPGLFEGPYGDVPFEQQLETAVFDSYVFTIFFVIFTILWLGMRKILFLRGDEAHSRFREYGLLFLAVTGIVLLLFDRV